jgi:hypothetical protein
VSIVGREPLPATPSPAALSSRPACPEASSPNLTCTCMGEGRIQVENSLKASPRPWKEMTATAQRPRSEPAQRRVNHHHRLLCCPRRHGARDDRYGSEKGLAATNHNESPDNPVIIDTGRLSDPPSVLAFPINLQELRPAASAHC